MSPSTEKQSLILINLHFFITLIEKLLSFLIFFLTFKYFVHGSGAHLYVAVGVFFSMAYLLCGSEIPERQARKWDMTTYTMVTERKKSYVLTGKTGP